MQRESRTWIFSSCSRRMNVCSFSFNASSLSWRNCSILFRVDDEVPPSSVGRRDGDCGRLCCPLLRRSIFGAASAPHIHTTDSHANITMLPEHKVVCWITGAMLIWRRSLPAGPPYPFHGNESILDHRPSPAAAAGNWRRQPSAVSFSLQPPRAAGTVGDKIDRRSGIADRSAIRIQDRIFFNSAVWIILSACPRRRTTSDNGRSVRNTAASLRRRYLFSAAKPIEHRQARFHQENRSKSIKCSVLLQQRLICGAQSRGASRRPCRPRGVEHQPVALVFIQRRFPLDERGRIRCAIVADENELAAGINGG